MGEARFVVGSLVAIMIYATIQFADAKSALGGFAPAMEAAPADAAYGSIKNFNQ